MRKIAVLLFIMLSAAACGKNIHIKEAGLDKRAFTSKAEMIWQGKRYDCDIERPDTSSLRLTVKGEHMQIPICYEISQGGYRALQGDLILSMPLDDAQPQSAAVEIYRVFLLLGQAKAENNGDEKIYKVSSSVLKCDKKTDAFTSLETENGKIIFKDFSFVSSAQ